jgi:hypothetical protein
VEPHGRTGLDHCFEVWELPVADALVCSDDPDCLAASGSESCGGRWHPFTGCSSLGFSESCGNSEFWARPGDEDYVCRD